VNSKSFLATLSCATLVIAISTLFEQKENGAGRGTPTSEPARDKEMSLLGKNVAFRQFLWIALNPEVAT
jgi:hypothetical protein